MPTAALPLERTSATPTKNALCCKRGDKTGSLQTDLEAFTVRAVNDACTSSARRNPGHPEDGRLLEMRGAGASLLILGIARAGGKNGVINIRLAKRFTVDAHWACS
mmetsp:Transcript_5640/g.9411  ORF Transcript_5640/g.9411 Transcript_5640/m.9411 type:complete len:106 (+) Transcript_5640:391-708(+)